MQKISRPESRTALAFEDTADMFLGALVAQHLTDLVPVNERYDVNPEDLHRHITDSLEHVVVYRDAAPNELTLWGAEARVMLKGLHALAAGVALSYDKDLIVADKYGTEDRMARAAGVLTRYYDPQQRIRDQAALEVTKVRIQKEAAAWQARKDREDAEALREKQLVEARRAAAAKRKASLSTSTAAIPAVA